MTGEFFEPTEDWPLQSTYKKELHHRIQKWAGRVSLNLQQQQQRFGDEALEQRMEFLDYLASSVERQDRGAATAVEYVDGYTREYLEGPGPYGRGGGSIDSVAGIWMSGTGFEALYSVYEAGKLIRDDAVNDRAEREQYDQ